MISEAKLDELNHSWVTKAWKDTDNGGYFRYLAFRRSLDSNIRIGGRFASHTERVEHALASPLTRFALESILAA